jgi:HSP20 family molecular chaperone IbpA
MSSESRSSRDELPLQPESHTLHSSGWNVATACIEPLYNLFVGATEVVITVDLPYVNQTQVKLQCPSNDLVEIYAQTSRKITFKDLGVKHRHGEFTCYHARIRIPVPVDESRINSKFKHGILEVHLPRLK